MDFEMAHHMMKYSVSWGSMASGERDEMLIQEKKKSNKTDKHTSVVANHVYWFPIFTVNLLVNENQLLQSLTVIVSETL